MDKLEITSASDFAVELTKLYKTGMPPGFPTGWEGLNDFYTVLPGQFTLVTGVPSHGKSTWLDCLTVNLAWMGWHFVVYTPEQEPPEVHMATLCEKVLHKPFRTGYNGCMEPSDIAKAIAFIDEHYRFLRLPKESNDVPTIADIVGSAHPVFEGWEKSNPGRQYGIVVDPWNELSHQFSTGDSETKYIGETLGFFRRVCRSWGCHGWIVAHPKQLLKHPKTQEYPIPRAYDISGCYSDETEVLTHRGWLKHSDIKMDDDDIACFDIETGTIEYAKPLRIIRKEYDGSMYHFTGYGYDLLVTPEHRMVVMPEWANPVGSGKGRPEIWCKGGWQFCEATDLPSAQFSIPLAATMQGSGANTISEDIAALAGWYVSEGCMQGSGASISQAEGHKADEIEALLRRLGLPYSVYMNRPGGKGGAKNIKSFYIKARGGKQIIEWLQSQCGCGAAKTTVPAQVLSSGQRVKLAFLDAYLKGDGAQRSHGGHSATTISQSLRDGIQRLCVEAGLNCSWHTRKPTSDRHAKAWQLNIGSRTRTALHITRNLHPEPYTGVVWCLTVPTGAYVVRRNGKACICGNSAHWYNKADNIITVWRSELDNEDVEIHIQKVRFRHVGKRGLVHLSFNCADGTYADPVTHWATPPRGFQAQAAGE